MVDKRGFDWAFWFYWIVATTIGWLVGRMIFSGVALIASGGAIALFQWLVLTHRIRRPWQWLLTGTVGWAAGVLIVLLAVPQELEFYLNGIIIGLTTGAAQWLALRSEVHWAGWWVVFSVVGWVTGMTILSGILLTGIVAGALTGIAMEVLLRHPKPPVLEAGKIA